MCAYRSSFDDSDRPSHVVRQALVSVGVDVETSGGLDRYIDAAGLDALFDASSNPDERELLVSFLVDGYQVILFGDRRILVRDVDAGARRDR